MRGSALEGIAKTIYGRIRKSPLIIVRVATVEAKEKATSIACMTIASKNGAGFCCAVLLQFFLNRRDIDAR